MDIRTEIVSPVEYKFIIDGSSSTYGELLQKELLKDANVTFAGYICPHPLDSKMIITVITSGKNPKEVMTNAVANIVTKLKGLEECIKLGRIR